VWCGSVCVREEEGAQRSLRSFEKRKNKCAVWWCWGNLEKAVSTRACAENHVPFCQFNFSVNKKKI